MAIGPSGNKEGQWVEIAARLYKSATNGTPAEKAHAIKSLKAVGKSGAEAQTIYMTAASIAKKAGSRQAFMSILKGEAETPIRLAPNEIAMLSGIRRQSGTSGNTWETISEPNWTGKSGRTWEGSEP